MKCFNILFPFLLIIKNFNRILKYKKFRKYISIKEGFLLNVINLQISQKKLQATGKNPCIVIRLFKPITRINIQYEVSNKANDYLYLFYLPYQQRDHAFSMEWMKKYGIANGQFNSKCIQFDSETNILRIDFGVNPDVEIKKIILDSSNNNSYYEKKYKSVLEIIKTSNNLNKLVIVTHSMNESGAPILIYHIAKNFHERNYDVIILSLEGGGLAQKYEELSIPVINLNQDSVTDVILDKIQLEYVVKTLALKGYKEVITNTIISGLTVPFFQKYNFKIISLIHEMKSSIQLYNLSNGGEEIATYSDYIVFPDKIVENDFYSLFKRNQNKSVIYTQGLYKEKENIPLNRKDVENKYHIPPNAKIITGSGIGDLRKGIDLFFNAAQQLLSLENKEEYHFIWAGNIADIIIQNWLLYQFERIGKIERIHITNFIQDKKEYQNLISCSDAFWLTSREDPYPSVMIESLEFGTPVLGFRDSGGVNTLLAENRGTLIDNFNTYQLAEETIKLLHDKEKVKEQIANAQAFIDKNLKFSNYINNLESLLTK